MRNDVVVVYAATDSQLGVSFFTSNGMLVDGEKKSANGLDGVEIAHASSGWALARATPGQLRLQRMTPMGDDFQDVLAVTTDFVAWDLGMLEDQAAVVWQTQAGAMMARLVSYAPD